MTPSPDLLLWSLAAAYFPAAALAASLPLCPWRIARFASVLALAGALAAAGSALWRFVAGSGHPDAPGSVMALLVALLAWVIVRFSSRYLEGEPEQRRYATALLFTVAAVGVVVATDNLGVLIAAWIACSLGLHHLLTFYRDRRAAQVVAHKKFLVSRLAEICLVVAALLLFDEAGTLSLARIDAHAASLATLPWTLQVASVLIALAVILKSAQLPLHGWLIQVMEAPTPVSALLHAGIVNIGGFVLIRLAGLMSAALAANTLLVVFGGLTAVLAGLVMMTRISIKVRLAWSTCAQMGFMLMECGLGLYELAFLHLVAHSLYKAHAFLGAGDTVLDARERALAPSWRGASPRLTLLGGIAAVPFALALVGATVFLWQSLLPALRMPSVALPVLALGLAPLLWRAVADGVREALHGALRILGLVQLYVIWHLCFASLLPVAAAPALPLAAWAVTCLGALYLLQLWLAAFPRGAVSTRLYPAAYAGFYLDERFTRFAFRVWPVRLTPAAHGALASNHGIA